MQKCRASAKSVTSGKKTNAAVLRVVKALGVGAEAAPERKRVLGPFATKAGRELRRRISDEAPTASWAEAARSSKLARLASEASGSEDLPRTRRQEIMAKYGIRDMALPVAEEPTREAEEVLVVEDDDLDPGAIVVSGDESMDDGLGRVAAAPAAGDATPPFVQYVDSREATLVRVYKATGKVVKAKMLPGPSGFGQAWFGEEGPIDTEVPNLSLDAPTAGAVMKRPARSGGALASAPVAPPSAPPPQEPAAATATPAEPSGSPPAARYIVLYYKSDGGFGLRRRFGDKKQVWSIRCKDMPSEDLRALMEEARAGVEAGRLSEQAAREWVRRRLPQ